MKMMADQTYPTIDTPKKEAFIEEDLKKTPKSSNKDTSHWKQCKWEDVVYSPNGHSTIKNIPIEKIRSKELRTICSTLNLKGVNNAQKDIMIARLLQQKEHLNGSNSFPTLPVLKKQKTGNTTPLTDNYSNIVATDNSVRKEKIRFMAKRDQREKEEHLLKMKLLQQEEKRKQDESNLQKWLKIQETIQNLQQTLRDETEVDVKEDIKNDICRFRAMKESLIKELQVDM